MGRRINYQRNESELENKNVLYPLLFGRKLQQHNVEFVCPLAVYSIVTFSNLLKAVKPSFIKIYELINNVKKSYERLCP